MIRDLQYSPSTESNGVDYHTMKQSSQSTLTAFDERMYGMAQYRNMLLESYHTF